MEITEKPRVEYVVDGRTFASRLEAEGYVRQEEGRVWLKAIDDARSFEVSDDHLKLYRHLNFQLYDGICVDGKRPFGNSDYIGDIAKIIGLEVFKDNYGEAHISEEQAELCSRRYRELKNFLDILRQFGEIPSGQYRRFASYSGWFKLHTDAVCAWGAIEPYVSKDGETGKYFTICYQVEDREPMEYFTFQDDSRILYRPEVRALESLFDRVFETEFLEQDGL